MMEILVVKCNVVFFRWSNCMQILNIGIPNFLLYIFLNYNSWQSWSREKQINFLFWEEILHTSKYTSISRSFHFSRVLIHNRSVSHWCFGFEAAGLGSIQSKCQGEISSFYPFSKVWHVCNTYKDLLDLEYFYETWNLLALHLILWA